MKIYFLSSLPCALRIGGVFFGVTDRFERYAEIDLRDNLFIEFLPENALPVSFFLTENIRFTPPNHCEVYLLKGGIAIYAAEFTPNNFSLKTLWQKRLGNALLTIFSQGRLQISSQRDKNVFVADLPPTFHNFEAEFCGDYLLVSGDTHTGKQLLVFDKEGRTVLDERILSYSLSEGVLQAELPLSERLGRTASCVWTLSKDGVQRTSFTLRTRNTDSENSAAVPEDLIPYAFFESVLIGADYAEFLAEDMREDADKIIGFLGDFIDVVTTDDPFVCGLVRKKAERLFSLSYYHVKLQKGKIIDING